ncbi:unnamed protein product [Bemisia tabaci]|uniref:Mitochondrial ATPase inhibitor n=1 Tax=Bemisia tabaci TaxID=7038 RepID=A0A9P0F3F2_BEMTA|nr:unnamed protein product [Bemisia tabaci]
MENKIFQQIFRLSTKTTKMQKCSAISTWKSRNVVHIARHYCGKPGDGAGKGGGGGGSIRDAGGAFGKREYALEESYFYKKQREQLKKLKEQWNKFRGKTSCQENADKDRE